MTQGLRVKKPKSRRKLAESGSGAAELSTIVACCTTQLRSLGCESCAVFVYPPSHRHDGFLCASEGD